SPSARPPAASRPPVPAPGAAAPASTDLPYPSPCASPAPTPSRPTPTPRRGSPSASSPSAPAACPERSRRVQSSRLLLGILEGEFGEPGAEAPSCAVFADTGWEPSPVYDWLDFLRERAEVEGFPVHVVSA